MYIRAYAPLKKGTVKYVKIYFNESNYNKLSFWNMILLEHLFSFLSYMLYCC